MNILGTDAKSLVKIADKKAGKDAKATIDRIINEIEMKASEGLYEAIVEIPKNHINKVGPDLNKRKMVYVSKPNPNNSQQLLVKIYWGPSRSPLGDKTSPRVWKTKNKGNGFQ